MLQNILILNGQVSWLRVLYVDYHLHTEQKGQVPVKNVTWAEQKPQQPISVELPGSILIADKTQKQQFFLPTIFCLNSCKTEGLKVAA